MRRYECEANERWKGFAHRADDIVISTRSKSGTTWLQMICALLVFRDPELPAPLAEISPWLDWDVEPAGATQQRLAQQNHRRIIKTHTPLDGLPLDRRVTYLVTGRDPLDAAVSMYHHLANIDRVRVAELRGRSGKVAGSVAIEDWLAGWVGDDEPPETRLESLRGTLHHVGDAWERQGTLNVTMVHYQDLIDDLEAQMRRLAGVIGVGVPEVLWPRLVKAATFDSMQARADRTVPQQLGVFTSNRAFFRSGRSGEGRVLLSDDELAAYERRAAGLAPAELLEWLHR